MKKNFFIVLLCINIAPHINGMQKTNPVDALLSDPLTILNNIQVVSALCTYDPKVRNAFTITDPTEARAKLQNKVTKYEKKHPLFLINECPYRPGDETCPSARKNNPHIRSSFEKKISNELVKKAGLNSPLFLASYVGFGSGSAFSDFVILAQTLRKQPRAHLHIHLIDPEYGVFIRSNNLLAIDDLSPLVKNPNIINGSQQIGLSTENSLFSCLALKHVLFTQAALLTSGKKCYNPNTIMKSFLSAYLPIEAQHKQFTHHLKTAFAEAQLKFFIHDSYLSYLSYIEQKQLPVADVIAASDIDSEKDRDNGSVSEYGGLCLAILHTQNPLLYNGMLEVRNNVPKRTFVSLEKINDDSIPVASESGDIVYGYLNEESL